MLIENFISCIMSLSNIISVRMDWTYQLTY